MTRITSFLVVALVAVVASTTFCDDANAQKKNNGTIIYQNLTGVNLGFVLDPTGPFTNQQQFDNAGGIVVNIGQTFQMTARAGQHTVGAGTTDFNPATQAVSPAFNVTKNQIVTVQVTGFVGNTPQFNIF